MATKTYTLSGTTTFNGVSTFRVANGKLNLRRNMLKHFGHTDINIIELLQACAQAQKSWADCDPRLRYAGAKLWFVHTTWLVRDLASWTT